MWKNTPYFRPRWSKSIPYFKSKSLKNHTLWGSHTYIPRIRGGSGGGGVHCFPLHGAVIKLRRSIRGFGEKLRLSSSSWSSLNFFFVFRTVTHDRHIPIQTLIVTLLCNVKHSRSLGYLWLYPLCGCDSKQTKRTLLPWPLTKFLDRNIYCESRGTETIKTIIL